MKIENESYVIFLDIDGTLMGGAEASLKRNLDIIEKVRSLGHKVFVNTGRSAAFLPAHIDVNRYFDGVVSGAGARITVAEKEIFCELIDLDDVKQFSRLCVDYGSLSVLEGVDKMFFVGSKNDLHPDWILLNKDNIDKLITDDVRIEKFSVYGKALQETVEGLKGDYVIIQHKGYAEIVKKGYSKAEAMKIVLEYFGIPREHSIAMGDSLNDFEMIEYAGIGVAMGNAIPEIKHIAQKITSDVDDAGVAVALEEIFEL